VSEKITEYDKIIMKKCKLNEDSVALQKIDNQIKDYKVTQDKMCTQTSTLGGMENIVCEGVNYQV